jgi:hypothetical protein
MMVSLSACVTAACDGAASRRTAQIDNCLALVDSSGTMVLIGEEGAMEVCGCVVDSLQARFPDADARWEMYATELEERMERRGLIGIAVDTAWMKGEGKAMAEFMGAHMQMVGVCSAQMVRRSMNGLSSDE